MYSTASVSSPSNTSLNTRKRSRTASAGGDYATASENGNIFQNSSNVKARPRSTKYNMRLLPSKVKSTKKVVKGNKAVRPTLKSLHNSIVLAPFHTLKKCFQSKLVDLYSYEKIKKKDIKERIAKKQNLSFEYDVFELNSSKKKNVKKWENEPKPGKKKGNQNDKQTRQKRNKRSKSGSYCQCTKNEPALEKEKHPKSVTNVLKNQKTAAKTNANQAQGSSCYSKYQKLSTFPNESSNKRRKLNNNSFIADNFGCRFEKEPSIFKSNADNLKDVRSNSVSSIADVSSLSNIDSWETYSDTPSYKEEHLEGSLAISTTSFDSVLEQYTKEKKYNTRSFQGTNSNFKTKYQNSSETQKWQKKPTSPIKSPYFLDIALDFPGKADDNASNHLIMNTRTETSDSLITNFMDREPQDQHLSSLETSHHLEPVQHQNKTKSKRLRKETENVRQYYLRSAESGSERPDSHNDNDVIIQNCSDQKNKTLSRREKKTDESSKKEQKKNVNVGVGTQELYSTAQCDEGDIIIVKTLKIGGVSNSEKSFTIESNISNLPHAENFEKNDKSDLPTDSADTQISEGPEIVIESSSNKESAENSEKSSQKNLNRSRSRSTRKSVDKAGQSEPQSNQTGDNELYEEAEANIVIENTDVQEKFEEVEKIIEPSESLDIQTDQSALDILENLEVRHELQGNSSSQPLDAESEFIFGTKNSTIRLGESCEFSFGLNRTYSDDEDSDNRDLLF